MFKWGGYIKDLTLSELRAFDFGCPERYGEEFAGTKICTVQEVLAFAKKSNVILEFDFGHLVVTAENLQKLWNLVLEQDYASGVIFEPNVVSHLDCILEVSHTVPVIYTGCDASLQIPEQLKKFDFVALALHYRKVGEETSLAKKIHDLGFKASTGVINPVPENPIAKMNEFISMGFDYIYADGIPYSAITGNSE